MDSLGTQRGHLQTFQVNSRAPVHSVPTAES